MFLTFIFFLGGWAVFSFVIARMLTAKSHSRGMLKVLCIAAGIFILPFLQEIYVALSFQAFCAGNAGSTTLNPVKASEITISEGSGVSSILLLEHPTITAVKVENNFNQQLGGKVLWIRKNRANECVDPIHQELQKPRYAALFMITRKVEGEGFCYSSVPSEDDPKFHIKSELWKVSDIQPWWLPSEALERRVSVYETTTGRLMSEYVMLSTKPGSLRQAIWPYYTQYECPCGSYEGTDTNFPFRNPVYQFLEMVIS